LDVGALFGETFSIYFRNFLPFLLLTLVAYAPVFALTFLTSASGASAQVMKLVNQIGSSLSTPFAAAALTFGVIQQMRRRDTSIPDCLRVGLSSLFPVLFVAILQGLAVGAGTLLCIVPGLIVMSMLAVSVPAAVEERPGIMAALNRSSYLTAGNRWQVFAVLFLLGLVSLGLTLLMIPLAGGFQQFSAATEDPSGVFTLATELLGLIPTGLSATASAVMYYRLRSLKEGIDVEEIASVFD